jgi:hypothetical protein
VQDHGVKTEQNAEQQLVGAKKLKHGSVNDFKIVPKVLKIGELGN